MELLSGFIFRAVFGSIGALYRGLRESSEAGGKPPGRVDVSKPHPVDLLDAWAREAGVRLLDFGRTPDGRAYRVRVEMPDGSGRTALVRCGDRAEAVWDTEGRLPSPAQPERDALYDRQIDTP